MNMRRNKNISYGLIVYKLNNNEPYYCLICRKDSFTFSEFIRGKYELEDVDGIYRIFRYMTEAEKDKILKNEFEYLWDNLWILDKKKIHTGKFKREFNNSKYKFDTLKRGYNTTIYLDNSKKCKKYVKLSEILSDINKGNFEKYYEPEWGFPKGKKNENENNFDCAQREFQEETNIPINILQFINHPPLVEKFIADNLQEYTHVYYIANCPSDINVSFDSNNYFQISEISSINWFNYHDVLNKIRSYNIEKKQIITQVDIFVRQNINLK
jgi:8-oxo-dGTP pyrophosphatase MutT (NUDIX family)